ncbi:uncharacterized protein LOC133721740 [Rosa rugosa]|uniref:uncharacterized protein LOC133721740 n=1 Tax=Rosa rugosa TaxID=74645 RepID=UPI002B409590|nr:uncharacterized protein LOC133721740 [Rosa rugosa]
MGSWGRQQQQQRGDTYHQRGSWTKFQNRKPPQHDDSWQFSVPSWEKKFCTSVGSVPWKKLLDTKRCMYLYENIVQWNDSAGEEAFQNAKNRFWAKINGLPCNISLPDPDIYIDEIDWNSSIDPELILDLEREPKPSDDETKGEGVIVGHPLLLNQSFSCTGWGDAEDDFKKDASRDAEHWGPGGNADNKENPWEPVSDQNKEAVGGWGSGCNKWENNDNTSDWNTHFDDPHKKMDWKRADRVYWGNVDARNRANNGGASWNNSRNRTSRFQGDYYQKDRGWRNGGRRNRDNVGYQRSGTWNDCQQV